MDAIETARQIASSLHRAAVEMGCDPWRPYSFALAEAERQGMDVEETAPGAAVLGGGRATYIPRQRLIVHENGGSDFDRAFLVAHEIGHVILGDGEVRDPSSVIDAARSAEPSPVGFDRVVDYGRRQRREVQMDLFAREFLLPRQVARDLHLGGMTAAQIVERLGAPYEVVAQQLLDALLLPPAAAAPDVPDERRVLNDLQLAAAAHRGAAFLLEAGPGTGKTQTLTARVEGLLADGVDPRRILLLTFSNKAAAEMAERIARRHRGASAAMWIGTFHAFGLDVVRRFHAELGLPSDPRMLDRTEAVELLEAEFPRLGLVHYRNLYDPTPIISDMLSAISRAKDEVVGPEKYLALAEAMREKATTLEQVLAAEKAHEVGRVYAAYERLKFDARCVDFGDLVTLPVRLLEQNPAIRAHFQTLYDHLLVDEYQDVNRSSVRLLTALREDGENLWAVGDAKQSIYRFRGASSFNMARFGAADFAGGVRGRLRRNYRSVGEVVSAFSSFASEMAVGGAESGLEAKRGASGFPVELRTVDVAGQDTVALADVIEAMRASGHGYRDQAVLATGNEKLSQLAEDLERLGVPVLFLGSLFDRTEVRELLALLSVLVDPRAMGLVSVGRWPEFNLSINDVAAILHHLGATDLPPRAWLNKFRDAEGLSTEGAASLDRLAGVLEGFDQTSNPWLILTRVLLDRTQVAARIASSEGIAERTRGIALWQFLNFVRAQPAGQGLPISRLLDRVRRLVRLGDDRELRQLPVAAQGLDAVRLMTIHGAKGLEFPIVHIPGMNADTLPRVLSTLPCPPPDGLVAGGDDNGLTALRAAHREEQECLFFVAVSRARERLFLYAPTRKSNGAARAVSPFLDRLGPQLVRQNARPLRELPVSPEDESVCLDVEGRLQFTGPQIALYDSCPRRFFYSHVLRVGGRRSQTPYMQMHEAVRTVVGAIMAGETSGEDDEAINARVVAACASEGLGDHGYRANFEALAVAMVSYLRSARAGFTSEPPPLIRLTFGDDHIVVEPDDVLVRPDGGRVVRRVRTGHDRSSDSGDVGTAAFLLAVEQEFPAGAAEVVHLSDHAIRPVNLSPTVLQNRRRRLAEHLASIRAGYFPTNPSSRTCPGCPAFFICGPAPRGVLRKKFS